MAIRTAPAPPRRAISAQAVGLRQCPVPLDEQVRRARRNEPGIEIVPPLALVAAVAEDRDAIREPCERCPQDDFADAAGALPIGRLVGRGARVGGVVDTKAATEPGVVLPRRVVNVGRDGKRGRPVAMEGDEVPRKVRDLLPERRAEQVTRERGGGFDFDDDERHEIGMRSVAGDGRRSRQWLARAPDSATGQ